PLIFRLKDGKEVELIARIRVASGPAGNEQIACQLVIDDCTKSDEGVYTCVVTSPLGSDKCSARLECIGEIKRSHRLVNLS
ncbi:unnamed protein product, partial [Soboliphyme baturini]|uniref:I-set domain-containing protein n=1 Tax=Soboliphyme baturini TaxID=241478 RepID=A0A183ILB7_9BILA